jgi:hypothetical protein
MRKIQLYLLLSVVVFATGCPKYRPKEVDWNNAKNTFVGKLNQHFREKQIEYSNVIANSPTKAQEIRNAVLEDVLPYIDAAYMDYITDLQAGRDRTNFVADLIELGTTAAVGIVNGERPLQIIGVALTAFRGGRRSADLNFYKEQSVPVLISKMDGNRAKVRATILTREREDVKTYSIGAAISDIVDYYNAGTLVRAFTELQKDTAVMTKQAEEDVLVLKGVPLSRPATQEEVDEAREVLPVLDSINTALNGTDLTEQAAAVKKLQSIIAALEKDKDIAPLLKVAEISSQDTDGMKMLNGLRRLKRSLRTDDDKQRIINRAIAANGN